LIDEVGTGLAVAVALAAIKLAEVAIKAVARRNGGGESLSSRLDKLLEISGQLGQLVKLGEYQVDCLRDLSKETAITRNEQTRTSTEMLHISRKIDAVHDRLDKERRPTEETQ
jgi:hypothetical protein